MRTHGLINLTKRMHILGFMLTHIFSHESAQSFVHLVVLDVAQVKESVVATWDINVIVQLNSRATAHSSTSL